MSKKKKPLTAEDIARIAAKYDTYIAKKVMQAYVKKLQGK